MKRGTLLAVLTLLLIVLVAAPAYANVSGAIFTTLPDGSRVNANIYQSKWDVYLDGGPGIGAPSQAAALDPGWYYFQVTDPSGKVLLSLDSVKCRKFLVGEDGFIIDVQHECTKLVKIRGEMVSVPCEHLTGIDLDYGPDGAITVQLMPYKDTPNNGGVYKVWVTPIDKFVGDPNQVDNPGQFHGFIPAWSKTDNYKVKGKPLCIPTIVTVKKFHDLNVNGVWDAGEPELNWEVEIIEPSGATNMGTTPFSKIIAPSGMWYFEELFPESEGDCDAGWIQTALLVDGVPRSVAPKIGLNLKECEGKTITIVYGNVRLACVEAAKFYDKDADGVWDKGEVPVKDFKITLTGTNIKGEAVDMVAYTDASGKVSFCGLLPGDYRVAEVKPAGSWMATTPECYDFALAAGDGAYFEFGNYCYGTADFNTKGFWHNKNGLELIQQSWIDYVNGLAPYSGNPFDGLDESGNPVPASQGPAGGTIAGEGTALAEISAYLVAPNAGGDPKIQLGQQLLAFTFNVKYNLGGLGATIVTPGGPVAAGSLIDSAIGAWLAGGSAANHSAGLLDGLNNCDAVQYVCAEPCYPIVY